MNTPPAPDSLFQPFDLGGLRLPNRCVMSPMTRSRAPADGVPGDLMTAYYAQRAGAGLIIAEGTCPLPGGAGFPGVPGLYSAEQVEGWRRVAEAVHQEGGRMFVQLWHCGRISSAAWQPKGAAPLGPSAVPAEGAWMMSPEGLRCECETPREASRAEIADLIAGFARAAAKAVAAGCDGVEIHGANGYLVHQFLSERSNVRTDAYGGSALNRIRFAVETAEAVAAAVGPARVGLRISPEAGYQDAKVGDPDAVYFPLLAELGRLQLAYVHCVEGEPGAAVDEGAPAAFDYPRARRAFAGAWIANNGYDRDRAVRAIARGDADLVSFGRPYVANPDLAQRLRQGHALNPVDLSTLYAGRGRVGYIDYPAMGAASPA